MKVLPTRETVGVKCRIYSRWLAGLESPCRNLHEGGIIVCAGVKHLLCGGFPKAAKAKLDQCERWRAIRLYCSTTRNSGRDRV